MAKVMSVQEALDSMKGKVNESGKRTINRFNKKNFTTLMVAMANDMDFTAKVAKVSKGELASVEDVMVTKEFRKWCKKLVEKAGIDKAESERVLSPDFVIDNMDGLYEFFATAVYEYINAGNQFDLLPTEDFKGGIYLKDVEESEKIAEAFDPKDHHSLGKFKTTKKKHKVLGVKSGCHSYLKSRIPV